MDKDLPLQSVPLYSYKVLCCNKISLFNLYYCVSLYSLRQSLCVVIKTQIEIDSHANLLLNAFGKSAALLIAIKYFSSGTQMHFT